LLAERAAASAQVSPALLQGVTTAALRLQTGVALAQTGASAGVVRLAQSWFKRAAIARVKVGGAVLLTVLLLVVTDYLAQQALAATASAVPKAVPADTAPSQPLQEYQSPPAPHGPEMFVDHVNSVRLAAAEKLEQ
jgi:hypothetical protein